MNKVNSTITALVLSFGGMLTVNATITLSSSQLAEDNGLNSFLNAGASFDDLKSTTDGRDKYTYWDVLISNGSHAYQVNTYDHGPWGEHPFNSNQESVDFPFWTPWTTWATTHGNHNVLAVTVPEPATIIVGALLLLPLGGSFYRILYKHRGV